MRKMSNENLVVEYRDIGELIPYARNARTHSDEQIAQIAGSIRAFGFNNPILVDKESGVIAGHGRLLAARKLGLNVVPVIELSHMSEEDRRAYIIADNQIALKSGWDAELLSIELNELKTIGVPLDTLGFDPSELSEFLGDDGGENPTEEEDTPLVSAALGVSPVSALGTIWHLGDHILMCGDATDIAQIKKISDGKADLLLTDPPYGIRVVGKKVGSIGRGRQYLPVAGDEDTTVAIKAIKAAEPFAENKIIFGGNYFTDVLPPSRCWLVWDKNINEGMSFADCELTWTSFDKNIRKYEWTWSGFAREGNKNDEPNRFHPNQKPVGLLAEILQDYSDLGATVLDLFGGSGATLIACKKTGRRCRMMEIEPRYVDLIVDRWQTYTGQKATSPTGEPFDEIVAAARGTGKD